MASTFRRFSRRSGYRSSNESWILSTGGCRFELPNGPDAIKALLEPPCFGIGHLNGGAPQSACGNGGPQREIFRSFDTKPPLIEALRLLGCRTGCIRKVGSPIREIWTSWVPWLWGG